MPTDEKMIDTKKCPAPADASKTINESELENVSGGLWNITILDTCENAFVADKCYWSVWGQCPRLIIESQKLSEFNQEIYCFTCTKGCYTKLTYVTSNFEK